MDDEEERANATRKVRRICNVFFTVVVLVAL
jgi:hypothetical protein